MLRGTGELPGRSEAIRRLVELGLRGSLMSVNGSIEATHELCADLDNLIELTKEVAHQFAPSRSLSGPAKICRPISTSYSRCHRTLYFRRQ
jgi:hypothetical protein